MNLAIKKLLTLIFTIILFCPPIYSAEHDDNIKQLLSVAKKKYGRKTSFMSVEEYPAFILSGDLTALAVIRKIDQTYQVLVMKMLKEINDTIYNPRKSRLHTIKLNEEQYNRLINIENQISNDDGNDIIDYLSKEIYRRPKRKPLVFTEFGKVKQYSFDIKKNTPEIHEGYNPGYVYYFVSIDNKILSVYEVGKTISF